MFVPEAYGGAPVSYSAYLACVREITEACAATGITWSTNFHAIKPLIDFGNEEQKARLLPQIAEGGLGALVHHRTGRRLRRHRHATRFTPDGDQILIDGGKIFITNGNVADRYLPVRQVDGDRGTAARRFRSVVVERGTAGLSVVRTEDKMGVRAARPRRSPSRAAACRAPI